MKSLNPSIFLYVQMKNINMLSKGTMVEYKICDIKRQNNAQVYHAYLELL